MARRKLNTKFIIILAVAIAVLVGGYFAVPPVARRLFRPSVAALEAKGDAALNAGDYVEATLNYGKAAARAGNNIPLQIKYIDALDYTVQGDSERYQKLREGLAQIVTNDPRSVPALERILKFQLSDVRGAPNNAGAVRTLANTAERLLQIDPKHVEARKAQISAVLEPYRNNLEVSMADVEKQRDAALALYDEQAGSDPDVTKMVVMFRLVAAQRAAQQGNGEELRLQLDKAKQLVDDAIAKRPEDGYAWMVRAQVYLAISRLTPAASKEQKAESAKVWEESLLKADALVKPSDDEEFLEVRQTALRVLELKNVKDAEQRYRQLVTELPNNRQPRIMLADFLAKQPARRNDAVAVLEQPWQPARVLTALESRQQSVNGMIEAIRLCTIKLGAIDLATDTADREKRLVEVEKLYADLKSSTDINKLLKPALLRIEGGIALERGRIAEAISTLDAAEKLLNAESQYQLEQEMRNDVLLEYAQAQLRLRQSGKAKPALTELVARRPDHLIARAQLADLLIEERQFDEAAKHVDFLQRVLPNNPVIEKMAIRLLSQRQDVLRERYAKMPESTRDQQLIKVYAANALGDQEEMIRLARLMTQANPADDEAATVLVQALTRAGRRDEATTALAASLQAKPDSPRLKSLGDALAAETPAQQQTLVAENIDKIADPYARELARAEFLRLQGKADEAIATLEKAQTLNANDGRAPDALFKFKLAQQKFDDAEKLLPTLASLNTDLVGGEVRKIELQVARAYAETNQAKRDEMFKTAVQEAARVSEAYREIGAASLYYGQLLQQSGDYQTAQEQFARTLDKAPSNLDALRGSVECLLALNRSADARKRLDQARQIAPDDERLRQLELTYELNFGDPLRAIDTLQQAVNRQPDNAGNWFRLGGALEMASRVREKAGDLIGAKQFLDRAAEYYGKAFEKFPADLRFAVQRAELLRRADRNADAEKTIAALADRADLKDRADVAELLAEQYLRSGKPADAERVLAEFLNRVDPKPASTVLRLCVLLAQQQRIGDALAVLDLRKDDPNLKRQRIELLLAAGEIDAARAVIDEAMANSPTADIYLVAAFVELRSGKPDRAEGFLKRVLEERPNDPDALLGRAMVAMAAVPPKLDAARDDLVRVRDIAPGNVEAAMTLADIYMRRREADEALMTLKRAWDVNPTSKPLLIRLADAYGTATPPQWSSMERTIAKAKESSHLAADPDVLLLEANMWISRKDMKKAQQIAKQALDLAPTNADLRNRYFDALIRAGAHRDLLRESEPMLAEDRGAWWLHRLRGMAYRRLDQKIEAQKEFDAAFNLVTAANNEGAVGLVVRTVAQEIDAKTAIKMAEPLAAQGTNYRLLLAQLYQLDNNPQTMLEQLERVMSDKPRLQPGQLQQTLQMLGGAYLSVTPPQPKKAREAYEELLKYTPNDVLLLNNLAYVLTNPESGGTPADALKYSQRSYDLSNTFGIDERTIYVWDTHGWVLVKSGKIEDGLALLRRAAETAKFPDVHLNLAEAYLLANDPQSASLALQMADRQIIAAEREKRSLDPQVRPRYERLRAEVAAKQKADPALGATN